MRLRVWSLALVSGLRIGRCRELWCRSQTQLGSSVAVALAWEPPYAERAAQEIAKRQKDQKKKKKKKERERERARARARAKQYYP